MAFFTYFMSFLAFLAISKPKRPSSPNSKVAPFAKLLLNAVPRKTTNADLRFKP